MNTIADPATIEALRQKRDAADTALADVRRVAGRIQAAQIVVGVFVSAVVFLVVTVGTGYVVGLALSAWNPAGAAMVSAGVIYLVSILGAAAITLFGIQHTMEFIMDRTADGYSRRIGNEYRASVAASLAFDEATNQW